MSQRKWSGRGPLAAAALVAIALPLTVGDPLAQSREHFTVSGSEVAIFNLAGRVQVVPGGAGAVTVDVTRGGRDADRLRIEQGPKGGVQALRVIYPGSRIVYPEIGPFSSSNLDVGEDGMFGGDWKQFLRIQHRVSVHGSGTGIHAWADLRITVPRGQRIRVHHVAGDVTVENVEGDLMVDHHMGTLDVHGTRGKLNLDTGSGAVTVRDVEGDILVDTGSGGVEMSGVKGTRLSLDTGSGSVRVDGADVERLIVDTGSGGVNLDHIKAGDVRLDTGSGHVDLELTSDVETLLVDTGSGGVTVAAPANLGAEFDIDTGSGGIDIDYPHQSYSVERDRVTGKIGDGRGRIHIDTGSGGVRLYRRTVTSERPSSIMLGMISGPRVG